jgi:hypothetical protein
MIRFLKRGLVAFAAVCGVLWLVQIKLRAEMAPPLLRMGSQLHEYERALPRSEGRVLELNGAPLRVKSGASPRALGELLDDFERECRRTQKGLVDPTLRQGDANHGFVVCLNERLRYAYVEREQAGSSVLQMWSEQPLRPVEMFPESGDAPGRDLGGIPRPPGARRLLSAAELDQPYGVAIYAGTKAPPREVAEFYRQSLRGWQLAPPKDCDQKCRVVARRGQELAIVLLQRRSGGTETTVLTSNERKGE